MENKKFLICFEKVKGTDSSNINLKAKFCYVSQAILVQCICPGSAADKLWTFKEIQFPMQA